MFLDGIFRCLGDFGNLLDVVSVEVKEGDGRAFFGWKGTKGKVQVLVFEGGLGGSVADKRSCLVDTLHRPTTRLVVEEGVVGDFVEPRAKPSLVLIACRGEVSLDQRILSQIIGIALVSTTESEQESSKGFLFALYMCYEYFASHDLLLCGQFVFFCFHLLGQHILSDVVVDEEGNAYRYQNGTDTEHSHWIISTA